MTAAEKRLANVLKRCQRTICRLDKEIDNLELGKGKLSFESPEYHLIGEAQKGIYEAKGDLQIVVTRIENLNL